METSSGLTPDVGLALSGGGFRASLFALGSLCRLNDLGYLPRINRISSVSGGSITAGYLGLKWKTLRFNAQGVATNFTEIIVNPLRRFCTHSIDVPAGLEGIFTPGKSIGDYVAAKYD